MPIYLITNKVTHARAVIAARSADEAKRMRPDANSRVWWKDGRWTYVGTFAHQDRAAPSLECWPDDLELVHADKIGRADSKWDCTGVLAFERDSQLRAPGEGPDETWGAQATLFENGA